MLNVFIARVLCEAELPYTIVHANKAWSLSTGYNQQEVLGGTLDSLPFFQASRGGVNAMLNSLIIDGHFHEKIVICKKSSEQYQCELKILPVIETDVDSTSSTIVYFLSLFSITLQVIPWLESTPTEICGDFDTPDNTNSPDDTNSPDGSDSQEESSSKD